MALTQCPRMVITAQSGQIVMLAELFKKGLPPVHGGTLDQTEAFLQAARFVWAEQAACEAEATKRRE